MSEVMDLDPLALPSSNPLKAFSVQQVQYIDSYTYASYFQTSFPLLSSPAN